MVPNLRGLTIALAAWACASSSMGAQPSYLEGYDQILPRGRIAAITSPVYVPADRANIAANSYVLGVVIDGHARAFSLNLLNQHEVVNDSIAGTDFAAVW